MPDEPSVCQKPENEDRPSSEIAEKIERAFDYRGHVNVDTKDGASEYGYVFNRDLAPAGEHPNGFLELYRASDDARVVIGIERIADIRFTGKDYFKPFDPRAG